MAVTSTVRLLYVFVVIEHGSRRLVRVAVTAHPRAAWTLQQVREVVGFDHVRRYLIHDRDSIFARSLDWLIPLSESHLRSMLRIGERLGVRAKSVLDGLHHEYLLAPALA